MKLFPFLPSPALSILGPLHLFFTFLKAIVLGVVTLLVVQPAVISNHFPGWQDRFGSILLIIAGVSFLFALARTFWGTAMVAMWAVVLFVLIRGVSPSLLSSLVPSFPGASLLSFSSVVPEEVKRIMKSNETRETLRSVIGGLSTMGVDPKEVTNRLKGMLPHRSSLQSFDEQIYFGRNPGVRMSQMVSEIDALDLESSLEQFREDPLRQIED